MSGRGGGGRGRGRGRGVASVRGGIRLPPSLQQQSLYRISSSSSFSAFPGQSASQSMMHHANEAMEKQRSSSSSSSIIIPSNSLSDPSLTTTSSHPSSTSMNDLLSQKKIPAPDFAEIVLPIPKRDLNLDEKSLINYYRTFCKLLETRTPYHIHMKIQSDHIQRYSDKYQHQHQFNGGGGGLTTADTGGHLKKFRLHDIQTDIRAIPLELLPIYKPEKAKMLKSSSTQTAMNLLELLNLDELEKNEKKNLPVNSKEGKYVDGGGGSIKNNMSLIDENEEEELQDEDLYDEEEVEEETDYNMDYFETGDDYGEYEDGGDGGGEEPYY